jgi:TonB family protein
MSALSVDSILRALATNAIDSLVLFAVVVPLAWIIRDRSPQMRHALWTIVLLRLALPPSLVASLSLWTAFTRLDATSSVANVMSISDAARASIDASPPGTRLVLFGLWLSGSTLVAASLLRSRLRLRRYARMARAVDEPFALEAFARAKRRLGVARRVGLVTGSADAGAFTIGTLNPVVFLSERMLARMTGESLECVLAHELVHVRRLDDLERQLQAILQCVFFFNPVAWIAGELRNRENELICDRLAITRGRLDPSTYGRSILDVLRLGAEGWPHVPTFIGRRRTMARRIDSIFRATRFRRGLTAATIVIGVALFPLSGEEPRRVEGDVVAPVVVSKVMPVYPPEARAAGVEGITIVAATIDVKGDVTAVQAVESTREDFTASAIEAVRQWRFKPATLEGKPVEVKFNLTLRFRLDDKKE